MSMSTVQEHIPPDIPENPASEVQRLRPGAVGLVGVLFMAFATAAPITAMTGNVPIAVGFGNGVNAPAGFVFATVVLTIFAVGYVAMARHITATGAFYGFISHGLGRVVGMASGLLATLAYVVFEASLIGIFSSFAKTTVELFHGPSLSWIVYATFGILIIASLGYFDISVSGKILGVFLVSEIVILGLLGLSVLFKGGGPDGMMWGSLNPAHAFDAAPSDAKAGVVGSAAIGLFFAFWSWVGFETTAVYGEESRNPKKIVPRATLIAVVGLGIFYVLISWLAVVGNGSAQAIGVSRSSNPFNLFYQLTSDNLGNWAKYVYETLAVTGSFACALAFHNTASRYLYSFGREGVIAGTRHLGRTHRVHKSPHVAGLVQSVITVLITFGFFFLQKPTKAAPDVAYVHLYGLMAVMGTMSLLIVQTICSVSVIWYFHVGGNHPETANWWRTFLAPLIGALGMGYVVYLLFDNLSFAAGAAAGSPVYTAIPYIVIGVFVLGLLSALALKYRNPGRFEHAGRLVLEESHER
jgi:amino acid transporter